MAGKSCIKDCENSPAAECSVSVCYIIMETCIKTVRTHPAAECPSHSYSGDISEVSTWTLGWHVCNSKNWDTTVSTISTSDFCSSPGHSVRSYSGVDPPQFTHWSLVYGAWGNMWDFGNRTRQLRIKWVSRVSWLSMEWGTPGTLRGKSCEVAERLQVKENLQGKTTPPVPCHGLSPSSWCMRSNPHSLISGAQGVYGISSEQPRQNSTQ